MEAICSILGNMSHIAKAVGIRLLHLPLFKEVGPLKCILQLSSDTLLKMLYEDISNYLFGGRIGRWGHYLHLPVMYTLGEELRPTFKEGLRQT